ncbi:MAG: molybdenum hydroxylase, partial [Candidatus Aminicenantes bacterium]|nr:molybdenum hydroxylase [Candidatus Aminicenantes bacterium]
KKGDVIGRVDDIQIKAKANGVIRGLIHDGVHVVKGLKIGDIDPTSEVNRAYEISEKANAVAGGVLEACLYLLNKKSTET